MIFIFNRKRSKIIISKIQKLISMSQSQSFTAISREYQINKSQILGKGSTGEVYLGKSLITGQSVAIKQIKLSTIDNEVTQYLLRMQKKALMTLNHQNVLKGYQIIQNGFKCYMITQFCNGGTLKHLIRSSSKLSQTHSLQLLKGILKGYSSLVRHRIVHRDIKPANIMLHNSTPKLIDFGYCEIQGQQKPSLQYNVGSPSYMAPESFQDNLYDQKTEIWAIGVVFYQCLVGKTFDDGRHMTQVFKDIKKNGIPFTKDMTQKAKHIISWCLEFNPSKRPTALQLIDFLVQKKPNEPEFFILPTNHRRKTSSLYVNNFDSQGLTNRKNPSIHQKIVIQDNYMSNPFENCQFNKKTFKQQTFQEKPKPMVKFQRKTQTPLTNRQNIKQKGQKQFDRQRIGSNYQVKTEYRLDKDEQVHFNTQKLFKVTSIVKNLTSQKSSALTSGLASPREMKKKSFGTIQVNILSRNPQSTGLTKPHLFQKKPIQQPREISKKIDRLLKLKSTTKKQNNFKYQSYTNRQDVGPNMIRKQNIEQIRPIHCRMAYGEVKELRPSQSIHQMQQPIQRERVGSGYNINYYHQGTYR